MPRRVGVPQRVIPHVAVPVEVLRVARVGYNSVGLDKPPQRRIVVARPVVVQPRAVIQPLAGELVGRGYSAAARGPIREVLGAATLRPAGDGRAPQACPELAEGWSLWM